MDKNRDLYSEERILIEKENDVADEKSRIRLIKEAYEDEHNISHRLLSQICEAFSRSDDSFFFEQTLDNWNAETRKSFEQLEERQYEISREERKIQDDLEEIMYEKRKLASEE